MRPSGKWSDRHPAQQVVTRKGQEARWRFAIVRFDMARRFQELAEAAPLAEVADLHQPRCDDRQRLHLAVERQR